MQSDWKQISSLPQLGSNELQLWRVDLPDSEESLLEFQRHLSPDELERADRLRAGQVRMQFVVARACLRRLLGFHLQLQPKDVPIILGSYGKPETPAVAGQNLFFNVAHSGSTIVIALCHDSVVGVDLEYLDRETDVLEIASNAFTQQEFREIESQPDPELRRKAFFCCWTRKEAIIKADGRGLSLPLGSFDVPVVGPATATPVLVPRDGDASVVYFVSDLLLDAQIVGAFAVQTACCSVARYIFPLATL